VRSMKLQCRCVPELGWNSGQCCNRLLLAARAVTQGGLSPRHLTYCC
jgi:hypothetical protein